MPVTFAAAFWLTNLISPGLAFIQATSSLSVFAGRSFLRDQELRIDRDQPDRLEVLLQVVVELVDDAADMGVPLADVDGVAIGRGARDAPDRDAAAGAADILDRRRTARAMARIRSAMIRAATSVEPPGGNGTTSVIGREGYVCACGWRGAEEDQE